jgi:hypothetical protein
MDEDNNPDRLLSEPTEPPTQQQERTSTLSLEPPPTGEDGFPINGDVDVPVAAPPPPQVDPNAKIVRDVVNSEVSTNS